MQRTAKIFSGTGSQYLSEKITQQFGNTPGKITIQHFSDGEIQPDKRRDKVQKKRKKEKKKKSEIEKEKKVIKVGGR